MSQPDDDSQEALKRLQKRLDAIAAERTPKKSADASVDTSIGDGYRLLGELIGGVVGGLGLGWVVDRFAHTAPFGVIGGLLLGTAITTYLAVKTASRTGAR